MIFFTIPKIQAPKKLHRPQAKVIAQRIILTQPLKADEVCLDQYLQKQYQMSLRGACIAIINNMRFQCTQEDEVVAILNHPQLEKLAQIIMFGNDKVPGCRLLHKAILGERSVK